MTEFNEIQDELREEDLGLFVTMELVSEIATKREDKGMSQRQLSELSGVPQKTISRIENGIDVPKIDTLAKLAKALGYTIEFSLKQI